MDIEINEVQEIIKNLESGGELSIKEEKYLKIAKLCMQLAAENAYLIPKSASELSNAWVLHKYLIGIQAAIMYLDNGNKKAAQEWLYGTIADQGFEFPDEVDDIDAWATHQMRGSISHPRALEIIKEETPATDRIVAGIKADGVDEFKGWMLSTGYPWEGDWIGIGRMTDKFAKQLREGADK